MNASTEIFCDILRSGLWDEPFSMRPGSDVLREVWQDARKQACRGLVGHALTSSLPLGPKTQDMVQQTMLTVAWPNLKLNHLLAESVKVLREGGIEPVLLKGQGVASYYKDPLLRESGDIDFYVGPEAYREAYLLLDSLSEDKSENEFEPFSKHSHVTVDGMTIEVHRYCEVLMAKYDPRFQEYALKGLTEGLRSVEIEGTPVTVPETTFNAFFIFNHIWRHFIVLGCGFRQICDWTALLHAEAGNLDLDYLGRILGDLNLMRPWQVFGAIAVRKLGLPESEMPFFDPKAERHIRKVIGLIMKEGNFGHEREEINVRPSNYLVWKAKSLGISTKRYLSLYPAFGSIALEEYRWRVFNGFGTAGKDLKAKIE